MTEELKERIAQINVGIAPAGYKKTKVGIVPEEWDTVKLSSISTHRTEKNKDMKFTETYTNSATQGIIRQTDYFDKQISNNENIDGYYIVCENDYVYNPRISVSAPCGPISKSHIPETGIMSPLYTVFRLNREYENNAFIEYYFKSTFWHRYMTSIANYGARHDRMNITNADLFGMPIPFPPLPEQQKIAEILTAQDEVIALLQKQIELLQKQKKAFLQKMFPKKGCTVPEIRFKGFTDAWEQYHLGDLYIERNEKGNDSLPILSVSIHSGVSDGELDTEALGKIVRRSEDKSTYKHVFCGDLVFNMMRAWQGAIGVVKREGMVSPAYISAIPNEKVYPPFMNYLLRRKAAVDQINDLSYGVTDFRKRLYWKSFIRVSCQLPSLQEQKMITELFESLDNLINQHQRKLELEQQKKKALMQLLLTGKVRCIN